MQRNEPKLLFDDPNWYTRRMIEPINWPQMLLNEPLSPFVKGPHQRPLRLTFHSSALASPPPGEAEALRALYQLATLHDIEALETGDDGRFPSVKIGALERYVDGVQGLPIIIASGEDRWPKGRVPNPQDLEARASRLAGQNKASQVEAETILNDLIAAQAHYRLKRDLLVTLSPGLLSHRDDHRVREANPRTPTEAAHIVGLFLRSRDNYIYARTRHEINIASRKDFYRVLAYNRLPNMRCFAAAWLEWEQPDNNNAFYLIQSAILRCTRALEARDAIGELFYAPQDSDSSERSMYHFDYLSLLLAGAFDAVARVAHRAYRIGAHPPEYVASFRKAKFNTALKKHEADRLYALVMDKHSQAVLKLIYEIRNCIHGAALPTPVVQSVLPTHPQPFALEVLPSVAFLISEASNQCGEPEQWGLSQWSELLLEPYSYAAKLVEEALKLLDLVVSTIDMSRLVHGEDARHSMSELFDGPLSPFSSQNRSRIGVLG